MYKGAHNSTCPLMHVKLVNHDMGVSNINTCLMDFLLAWPLALNFNYNISKDMILCGVFLHIGDL